MMKPRLRHASEVKIPSRTAFRESTKLTICASASGELSACDAKASLSASLMKLKNVPGEMETISNAATTIPIAINDLFWIRSVHFSDRSS